MLQRCLAALFLILPALAEAQGVVVAPHAVYIDHATRSGSLSLYNPGEEPVEVTLSFGFGIPVTDSAGTIRIELLDVAPAGEPAATAWLQAYPRRVSIPPQQRQTIRLLATPPAQLPDGEYWARLVVEARGGTVPVSGAPDSGAIRVGLNLIVRTVIAVVYRKGVLTTGVTLAPITASHEGDSVAVRVPLTRTGTAAYLGTARAQVIDARGQVAGQTERSIAVYHVLDPRLDVPVDSLPPGRYKVRVEVTTTRADLPPGIPLPAPPVRDSVEVTVP